MTAKPAKITQPAHEIETPGQVPGDAPVTVDPAVSGAELPGVDITALAETPVPVETPAPIEPTPTWPDNPALDALIRSLTNITPDQHQVDAIEKIRASAKSFANILILAAPSSRERSLAITNFEQTVMWAVKAVLIG